ncbi:hypothetical protein Sp245p_26335 (plasmid) [Azospirillum baldaniorum]|uniref:Uncharacterized protein n=1 Tax=Azospirillum baldaniorum TaxID=1064539 RepID=A0A9P1NRH3_9PROT|nr:hypothetical protein [Azospirillum baldaniorum]AWJ92636.1 hypothetical protein Sp245p_22545 [Azospirillum baldaniorum]AWJ93342.1 hypothetical protein Sp245p_26335 [Azospirillum baldaniorum]TWA78044.1 hypothetical protein FBZ85_106204 [Azospirillum brasilense]CCD02853.1 protein of unknown function [Azospirillum baldaniorum]
MNRADRNVLMALERAGDWLVPTRDLPNGHGHVIGAGVTAATLSRLERSGLMEYVLFDHGPGGWRITAAGRELLATARLFRLTERR